MEDMATGIFDKTGKEIHIGDTVMWSLGTFAKKSGGPRNYRIIRLRKRPHLAITLANGETGGIRLKQHDAQNMVIIEHEIRQ